MFLVGIISWWYGGGLRARANASIDRLLKTADYFSLGLLVRTLFAPFRQVSAGSTNGPVGVQIRAFFDKLFSRLVGAVVRLFLLVFGLIALLFQTVWVGIVLIVWPLIPVLPIVGVVLLIMGVPLW